MPTFDFSGHVTHCTIAYCGPRGCGKSATLKALRRAVPARRRGELKVETPLEDENLVFERFLLELELGHLADMKGDFHLLTVPAQTRPDFRNVDGVVFVADSDPRQASANERELALIEQELRSQKIDPKALPFVFQFNKRDLANAMPVVQMNAALNPLLRPVYESNAATGAGVMACLKHVAARVLRRLEETYRFRRDPDDPGRPPAHPRR